ncbi:MAG: DUF63 family protein [Archaeoglobaceae archaeon]|nr:DUF63 family protein [Archaeoglobaceae archaeon]MDW8118525.1 DUF63 family protein [Archaeoglobaceae archaeon]
MDLWGFIKEYYIDSIVYKEGYNIVNTLTWAIILVIAVFLIYKFLEKRFEIDVNFILANVPYILLGSSARVVEDAGFLKPPISYVFMSPLIFFLIFFLAFPTLLVSRRFFGEKYYIYYASVGLLFAIATIILLFANLRVENPLIFPYGITGAVIIALAFYLIPIKTKNLLTASVIFAHMLDGFVTFLGVQYHGYVEIHVLPRFITEEFGAIALPIAKFGVIASVLYLIDASEEKESLKNFLKFTLLVLGLAPALRNGLRIMFGV